MRHAQELQRPDRAGARRAGTRPGRRGGVCLCESPPHSASSNFFRFFDLHRKYSSFFALFQVLKKSGRAKKPDASHTTNPANHCKGSPNFQDPWNYIIPAKLNPARIIYSTISIRFRFGYRPKELFSEGFCFAQHVVNLSLECEQCHCYDHDQCKCPANNHRNKLCPPYLI